MKSFNRQQYLDEIAALLTQAKINLKAQAPEAVIYTLNVWTDPDAATSAVNFDTRESSDGRIAYENRRQGKIVYEGRICNPADFAFSGIAECSHNSIPAAWEEASEGKCWDILEPVLLEVRELAHHAFSDLDLDPEAELSVNSREDWYDHPCHIMSGKLYEPETQVILPPSD